MRRVEDRTVQNEFRNFAVSFICITIICCVFYSGGINAGIASILTMFCLTLTFCLSDGDPTNDWNVVLVLIASVLGGAILLWIDVIQRIVL